MLKYEFLAGVFIISPIWVFQEETSPYWKSCHVEIALRVVFKQSKARKWQIKANVCLSGTFQKENWGSGSIAWSGGAEILIHGPVGTSMTPGHIMAISRKRCISGPFIAKQSPQAIILWPYLHSNWVLQQVLVLKCEFMVEIIIILPIWSFQEPIFLWNHVKSAFLVGL